MAVIETGVVVSMVVAYMMISNYVFSLKLYSFSVF